MDNVTTLEDLALEFTEDEAIAALNVAVGSGKKTIGFTTEQLSEITGWSVKKVRKQLRALAREERVVRNMFPVVSLLDGKAYPIPHYLILPEKK